MNEQTEVEEGRTIKRLSLSSKQRMMAVPTKVVRSDQRWYFLQ
jgi:hypothetical protein